MSERTEAVLDRLERRARAIAGGIHSRGAIPAHSWRQAIAEEFLGEPIRDPEWAERIISGTYVAGIDRPYWPDRRPPVREPGS